MKMLSPERKARESQTGAALLPLAIILLSAGTLLLVGLMVQLSTNLIKIGNEREQRMKVYAAEAAINRVIADLIRGADGVSTTYTTTQPHTAGGAFDTFIITTSYTAPSITVNDYIPTVAISLPTPSQAIPPTQQNYVDPGVTNPQLATIPAGKAFLMRLYNVKAGTIQVNWAFSPSVVTRVGIWAGMPVDSTTKLPYQPGLIDGWPRDKPILDTGNTSATATSNRTAPVTVDPATDGSGGVYTIGFGNPTGNTATTTAPFAPSGGPNDTWIYAKAYKDYIITAAVGSVSVATYVRQVPGFAEPPSSSATWGPSYVSFITNEVYAYTWLSP